MPTLPSSFQNFYCPPSHTLLFFLLSLILRLHDMMLSSDAVYMYFAVYQPVNSNRGKVSAVLAFLPGSQSCLPSFSPHRAARPAVGLHLVLLTTGLDSRNSEGN